MVEMIRIEVFPNTTNFNFGEQKPKPRPPNPSKFWKLMLFFAIAHAFTNLLRFADALPTPVTSTQNRLRRHFPINEIKNDKNSKVNDAELAPTKIDEPIKSEG